MGGGKAPHIPPVSKTLNSQIRKFGPVPLLLDIMCCIKHHSKEK